MTDFSGIDPQALHGMITTFSADTDSLHDAYSTYYNRFGELGLDTSPLAGLNAVAQWMDDQLPHLKRRYTLALVLEHGGDFKRMVRLPEPVMSLAETQREAKALAKQLSSVDTVDAKGAAQFHTAALELAAHQDDPDYCAAFYGALEPPTLAQNIPTFMAETGSKTASDDLKIFSHALGSATRDPNATPEFDKVKKLYTTPVPKGAAYPAGWDRVAMMHYGDFDTTFLAAATRAAVLDQVAEDVNQDFSGSAKDNAAFGLPRDTVALALSDLSKDGSATFTALSQMGDPKHPDLQSHLDTLFKYAKSHATVQNNLTNTVNVAAGVSGHTDSNGDWHADPESHNAYQSTFAFDAMIAAGRNSGEIDQWYDGAAKSNLGRLAASYPQEMVSSGNGLNSDIKDSVLGVPTDFTNIPGVNPAFVLSGSDTYRFLKTFAGSDSFTAPYDEVMGDFQHTVLVKCAQEDSRSIHAGKGDPEHYEDASQAFGNIQRLEFDAESRVRGGMDAADEANREAVKRSVILGVELGGEPDWGHLTARLGWRAFMLLAKELGGSAYVESGDERTEGVEDAHYETLMQTRYTATSTLLEGGWRSGPLPEELKGPDGKLASYEELARGGKLEDFDYWVNQQRGGPAPLQQKQAHGGSLLNTATADGIAHEVDES